jgi:hypothetical protein
MRLGSKVFKLCTMDTSRELFVTSDEKFDFKAGVYCNQATYKVRKIAERFTNKITCFLVHQAFVSR